MHQQYSTQWDGFPHSFYSGKMYNGYDSAQVTALGTAQLSIHHWADKIVTRGILLDIAKDCDADGVYEFVLLAGNHSFKKSII